MKPAVMPSRQGNRRRFLRQVLAAASAPWFIPASALGLNGATAPSNRIVLAAIGLGYGWQMFLHRDDTRYVAVCDVQQSRREQGKRAVDQHYQNSDCRAYNDFREVVARPDVDAVYIASPDHWHAVMTIAAARAGKDVYCQKPLTRTIAEGRAVMDAVRRYGIVFQHGTQQRHDLKMLFGCELVRNGYIGRVQHVKIGSPAGMICEPQPTRPVPPGLDWEMWLGPAPWAPFTPLRIESQPWYHISDYCMGYIAGWGVHHADSAAQACGFDELAGPIEVDARGIFPADGLFDNPYRWQMDFKFSNGVTWHWTDMDGENEKYVGAGVRPRPSAGWHQHPMGIRIEGEGGWVFIWRGQVDAHPKRLLSLAMGVNDAVRLVTPGSESIPDFIECVKRRRETCAPVEIAHRSTSLCSAAAISMLLRRKVVWDPLREQFVNDDVANRLQARALREPWTV